MTKFSLSILTLLVSLSAVGQPKKKLDFPLGEQITFRVSYGWFALGEATMSLADSLIVRNNETFYHSYINAQTVGIFSWLGGVKNEYWGYVNTSNYKTIVSEKHLDERKGKFDQWNTFDYHKMETYVKMMDYTKEYPKKEVTVSLNDKSYDLHGTYMYLRSKLWSGFKPGESILLNTYWEDKLYDFGMEYGGKEKIKFDGEKVEVHKFYGLFPISRTFPKEKAVVVWVLEKDGMGIPLVIEADMKIGKVRCELKEYSIRGKSLSLF